MRVAYWYDEGVLLPQKGSEAAVYTIQRRWAGERVARHWGACAPVPEEGKHAALEGARVKVAAHNVVQLSRGELQGVEEVA